MTLHDLLDRGAAALRMCGHGDEGNWFVRVADRFFIDCPCCLFWRGVGLGTVASLALAAIVITGWSFTHDKPVAAPVAVDVGLRSDVQTVAARLVKIEQQTARIDERVGTMQLRMETAVDHLDAIVAPIGRIDARGAGADKVLNAKRGTKPAK